jgi:hypothetical protein
MTQRDCMRSLYQNHKGSEASIIRSYADAERRGLVDRNSNEYDLTPESYAQALYKDGMRKGWIQERIQRR